MVDGDTYCIARAKHTTFLKNCAENFDQRKLSLVSIEMNGKGYERKP